MATTNGRTVTVFGGTGFLGSRVVRRLGNREFNVRIASRHPDRGRKQFGPDNPLLQSVEANIHDEQSVADALTGAYGVVNAVSLYVERGRETFHSVHVEFAQRIATQARRAGVRTARSRFRNWGRCRLAIAVHPKARGRRTGGPGRVRQRTFHPSGGDVRTGGRVSHHHPQAPPTASNLSNVRPRLDEIAAGLCGRCGGGDFSGYSASRGASDDLRVRRTLRLLLRGIS